MAFSWDFVQKLGGRLAAVIANVVLLLFAFILFFYTAPEKAAESQWLIAAIRVVLVLIGVALVSLFIFFPIVFRADVSTKDDRRNERRMRRIILYSYSFAALSLVGSLLPFVVYPNFVPRLYKAMLKSPVGVVLGCSETEKPKEGATEGKTQPKPGQERDQKKGTTDQGQTQRSPKSGQIPKEIDCEQASEQWVVNIGGMILPPKDSKDGSLPKEMPDKNPPWWPRVRIQGGLVVPLYFIVLSLIGGAVSLTRRVPEFHRRYSIHYVPTETKPKLDRATVREYLAFQIIQFLSAPLLAVVAYYLVAPESRAGLIALGFTAGFSSEAILLMIRSLVEKISPGREAVPQTGSASGNVIDKGNQTTVAGATVTVVGKPTLTAQTDQRGHFVINGIPPGDQVIEATYQGKKGTTKVTIEAGKTSVCHIEVA